jgi:hypothetical protein
MEQEKALQIAIQAVAVFARACDPPTLDTGELEACVLATQAALPWVANSVYLVNQRITPGPPNGYFYLCLATGLSGATQPQFSGTGTIVDGTCTWVQGGLFEGYYDHGRAIFEAWRLKAAKAAALVAASSAGQNYQMQTVYEQCQQMARNWQPSHAA